eukprot:s8321_g1.t1
MHQDQDDLDHKQMLKRSNSWSASSSSDVDPSSVDDFLVPQQPQLRPEHVVWHDSSETTSESAASTAHGRVSMEEKIRMEKVAAVQAKIRELTQSDPMLGEDGPPPEIVYGWSQGSANHDNGKCTPCIHFTTRAGCKHAEACRFCHLEHGEDGQNHEAFDSWARRVLPDQVGTNRLRAWLAPGRFPHRQTERQSCGAGTLFGW